MLFGFLFLTLLIICVAIVSLFILNKTKRIAAIHGQISQLEIATLSLIKTDNDFFDLETINSHYFETHKSSFFEQRDSIKIKVHTGMDYIYSESRNGVIESLLSIDSVFTIYDKKFQQLEGLFFKRGFKNYGLEGKMRFHAHKLEENQFKMNMLSVLSLRRNEKDFFLRHEMEYTFSLNTLANSLLTELRKQPFKNQAAIYHLGEYQRLFNELTDIHIQIGLGSNDGLRNELNRLSNELTRKYFALSAYSYEASNEAQKKAQIFYLSIVIGAIIFSVLSGYWISKKLSSPIARLSNIMNSVTVDKKKVKMDLELNNAAEEINTLTSAFIHLLDKTNKHVKKTKLKSRLLRKKNRDLKKLNAELDRFIYSTAHDLRSPLSSLLGLLNIIRFENKQEELIPYFSMMQGSILRLDDFIGQIVGYSKNKRLEIVTEKIDFLTLIAEVFDSHRFVEGADKIDRFVEIDDKSPLYSDRVRITILFNNLISNAIRYADLSKTNPHIKILVSVEPNEAVIEFSDNGIGIEEEHIDKVFNMFYRANVASKGSGLGLYIFKETISKLNGLVSIESTLTVGTKYFIRLPNQYIKQPFQTEIALMAPTSLN